MNKHPHDSTSGDNAAIVKGADDWLTRFDIAVTSSQNALYANGRQEVEVTITVEARDSQDITDAQLNSIKLYVRDGEGNYLVVPMDAITEGDWVQKFIRDSRFDYFSPQKISTIEATVKKTDPPSAAIPKSRKCYLATMAAGGSTETFSAGIEYESGTTYYSQDAPFNETITVTAVRPIIHDDPTQFNFTYSEFLIIPGRYEVTYVLAPNANTLRFVEGTVTPSGMIRWDRNEEGNTFATNVGWVQTATKIVQYESSIINIIPEVTMARMRSEMPFANASSLVIYMQADNAIPYDRETAIGHGGPLQVVGIDNQGNLHQLSIAFEGTTRNRLTIR